MSHLVGRRLAMILASYFAWTVVLGTHAVALSPRTRTPSIASHLATSTAASSPTSPCSSQQPSPTAPPECVASCWVTLPADYKTVWTAVTDVGHKTITAGTVVTRVDRRHNTTKISTIFNALPSGYKLPDVNSDGERVETVSESGKRPLVLTYPTVYGRYDDGYEWGGTLPVQTNGRTICATATRTRSPLPSHPPALWTQAPIPGAGLNVGLFIFRGNGALEVRSGNDNPSPGFYNRTFPDVPAFQHCSMHATAVAPQTPWLAGYFVYESMLYID